ncbi:MAG: choice-of-anchor J domain-containing protein [Anditalea sp.]
MKSRILNDRIRLILSFFFAFLGNALFAQNFSGPPIEQDNSDEKCAANYIEEKQIGKLGVFGTRDYFEFWVEDKKEDLRKQPYNFKTEANGNRKIPVVIHVIHNGTPIGEGANIPFSQIQAQIDILNEDYRKLNPDAANIPEEFESVAADANIEFVLAKQDPSGLPTNGINRIFGSKEIYTPDDAVLIGQLALWPPEDYLNIWVITLKSPFLGYSSFPVSELPGLDFPANTRETDGVTIDYRVFGEGGNALSTSLGRTTTHEVGHFLGLRHIWGDGGCEVDDYVEDTPNQSQSNNTCLATPRITCDSRDMIENFMDYTPDQCMGLFTLGQVERIDVVLNFSPRRTTLVNGRATLEPALSPNDLALKAIVDPQNFVCATDITPSVSIVNVGNNEVTSTRIQITLNGQVFENENFSLNLEPGATDTLILNPISLHSSTENNFEAEIVEVNGSTDPNLSNNSLNSIPVIQPTITIPYTFNSADFSNLWTIKNPDNALTWNQISLPIEGTQQDLIYLNGFNYETQGELDYFISPQINLAETPNAQLAFKMAFAPYADEEFQESLLIAVSTDCGNTFELLEAPYQKTDEFLATEEPILTEFFPDSESQFRTELVNLDRFEGYGDIRIAFISFNGYGNNMYLKDIEINPSEEFRYDFEIERLQSPGPIVDGSQEREILQITNTGNLPITAFMINRKTNNSEVQTFFAEYENLPPGETIPYALPNSLDEGMNKVEYEILYPNFDQNGDNQSQLTWHFIQDDSLINVPWRQDFNTPALQHWLTINPEKDNRNWEVMPLQAGEQDNRVLALNNAERGNSYWLGSPLFDLSDTPQASIFFDWASGGFNASDLTVFEVLISTDGGVSYEELWSKTNTQINTVTGGGPANPNTQGDYVREYIDLSAFTGEGNEEVRIAFRVEYQNGGSNPIYLDDIELFLSANPDPVDPGPGNSLIFPNPATDFFNITFNLQAYENVNIQFINSTGQTVHDVDYPRTLNQTYTFSTSLFSRGVYIVKITSDSISESKRLIIQ